MSCVGLEFVLGSIRHTFIRDLGHNREANYDISDLCNLLSESGVENEIYSAIDRSLNENSHLARRIYHAGPSDCVSAQPALELCYHRIFSASCNRWHKTTGRICVAAAALCPFYDFARTRPDLEIGGPVLNFSLRIWAVHDILGVTCANQLDETHPPVAAAAQRRLVDKAHQLFDSMQEGAASIFCGLAGLQLGRCCTCMPSGFERFAAEVKWCCLVCHHKVSYFRSYCMRLPVARCDICNINASTACTISNKVNKVKSETGLYCRQCFHMLYYNSAGYLLAG